MHSVNERKRQWLIFLLLTALHSHKLVKKAQNLMGKSDRHNSMIFQKQIFAAMLQATSILPPKHGSDFQTFTRLK